MSFSLFGQTFQNGFNFYLPPYDSTSQKFLPYFERKPISGNEFVSTDNNGHFSVNGGRIKFWGGNLTVNGAMPDKDKAAGVAGRLRKLGINIIRLQDIDRAGLIFTIDQSTRQLNPTQLDKMEYLISQLKSNGIYVDMNMMCSREFNALDGVTDPDSIYLHIATLFDPQLIDLQKEYAYNLLKHKNSYTGLALADDPVMASVEITNENSLFSFWISDQLQPFSMNGKLSYRHDKMLEDLWNDYLFEKYGSTEKLDSSWTNSLPEMVNDGSFENSNIFDKWYLYLDNSSCQASLTEETSNSFNGNGSAKISIQSLTGMNWHIQLIQFGFSSKPESPGNIG